MVANLDVVIKNNDNGYYYYFRGVSTFKPRKSQPVISIPLVNTTPANTVLFRFFGQSETVVMSFAIFNDGEDAAQGTYTSPVITVAEQLQYLKDVIFSDNYDVDWDLWDTKDLVYPSSSAITCVMTNLDFDLTSKANVLVIGNVSVHRGRIGLS